MYLAHACADKVRVNEGQTKTYLCWIGIPVLPSARLWVRGEYSFCASPRMRIVHLYNLPNAQLQVQTSANAALAIFLPF